MAKNPASRERLDQPLLTPPPAALKRALKKAAKDARRLAVAYGVKVPTAGNTKT